MKEYHIIYNFQDKTFENSFAKVIESSYKECVFSSLFMDVVDIKTYHSKNEVIEFLRYEVLKVKPSKTDLIIIYSQAEILAVPFNPYKSGISILGDKKEYFDSIGKEFKEIFQN